MSDNFSQFYLPADIPASPFKEINGKFILENPIQTPNFVSGKNGIKIDNDEIRIGNFEFKDGETKTTNLTSSEYIVQIAGTSNKAWFKGGFGDSLTSESAVGGSVTRAFDTTELTEGGGAGSLADMFGKASNTAFNAVNLELIAQFKMSAITNQDAILGFMQETNTTTPGAGIPAGGVLYADFVGFVVNGGVLTAQAGQGGVGNVTTVTISGITLTNFNTYRIIYTGAVSCLFYIDNILVATIKTNLPNITEKPYFYIGIQQATSGARTMTLKHPFAVLRTD